MGKLDKRDDSMHIGGSITDELREWMDRTTIRFDDRRYLLGTDEELTAIADRIDAEHEETIQQALMGEGGVLATDENMAEHGWYRALDADKKPIRLGDKVYQVKGGWVYTVKSISFYPDNTTVTFACEHGFGNDSAHNLRHYHEPTVEDVLREFAQEMNENLGMYTSEAIDADEWRDTDAKTIAEYAAKLRLAEGKDA